MRGEPLDGEWSSQHQGEGAAGPDTREGGSAHRRWPGRGRERGGGRGGGMVVRLGGGPKGPGVWLRRRS